MHKNGFKSFEIKRNKNFLLNEKAYPNSLFYYATYSSFYTRKVMYEKFGNWDQNYYYKGKKTPFLIWRKVKLFPDKNQYFYVVALSLIHI